MNVVPVLESTVSYIEMLFTTYCTAIDTCLAIYDFVGLNVHDNMVGRTCIGFD